MNCKKIIYGFILAALLWVSSFSYAVAHDLATLNYLPDGSKMSVKAFQEESQTFEHKNEKRPYLRHSLLLPKTWSSSFFNEQTVNRFNPNFLTDLGRYISPPYGDKRAFVSIQATVLRYESFAEDWMRNQILMNGFSVKAIDVKSPTEVEALYTALEGDITFAVRARVVIDGNILYFVRYALPIEYFSQRADHQYHVVNSFKLLSPNKGDIEKTRRFSMLDALAFSYPSSWTIKNPNFKNPEHLSVDLYRLEQDTVILGRISLETVKKDKETDLNFHVSRIISGLKEKNVELKALKDQQKIVTPPQFIGDTIEIYSTFERVEDGIERELWFFFLENEEYYSFFSMVTPTKEASYTEWARNRAALTKVLSRLH